jgi:hypothetical protein
MTGEWLPPQRVGHAAHLLLDEDLLQRGAAAAAEFPGHVGGRQPQFAGPLRVPGDYVGRQFPARHLGLDLEREQFPGERRGAGLEI